MSRRLRGVFGAWRARDKKERRHSKFTAEEQVVIVDEIKVEKEVEVQEAPTVILSRCKSPLFS